ncbi:MAG: hypothetical protein EBT45_08430 [Alphaproteobacteria bacterium]|nr:hypothetical protein [Alphaproteobacteria bacterium]
MAKSNVAQHEQHLKSLESSIKEICDKHRDTQEAIHDTWKTLNDMWSMTMQLFVVIEEVRETRLEFEKEYKEN